MKKENNKNKKEDSLLREYEEQPSNDADVFETKANPSKIVIGYLGKGKSFNLTNQSRGKDIS